MGDRLSLSLSVEFKQPPPLGRHEEATSLFCGRPARLRSRRQSLRWLPWSPSGLLPDHSIALRVEGGPARCLLRGTAPQRPTPSAPRQPHHPNEHVILLVKLGIVRVEVQQHVLVVGHVAALAVAVATVPGVA
jgi:hypothetical protein